MKIFGIGFHKTGTSSLGRALELLGYRVTGPNGVRNPNIAQEVYQMAFELAEEFDAFQDNPWPILYRELDQRYRGSKFILTIRSPEHWIQSVVRHFGSGDTPMREWIYGVGHPLGNEEIYLERFKRHNREVLTYFRDRPGNLLVMNLEGGHGWTELCGFLDRKVPLTDFPFVNSAEEREGPSARPPGMRSNPFTGKGAHHARG